MNIMNMNVIGWEYAYHKDCVGSQLMGYVQTNYQHIVNVLGEPRQPYCGKVTAEWAVLVEVEDVDFGGVVEELVCIYDWKMTETPMGNYQWHIGGFSPLAVDLAEWFLGHDTYADCLNSVVWSVS